MSISRVAAALTVAWYAANTAVLTRAEQVLNEASDRFEGVEVLGVDDSAARVAPVREVPLCLTLHQAGRQVRSPWLST